jgi:3-oxoacyl-[acyl-carrier-protein] synthase II
MIPPTINLDDPDPAIRLNAVRQPRRLPVRTVLKTSAGLGGVHAALVFESPSA